MKTLFTILLSLFFINAYSQYNGKIIEVTDGDTAKIIDSLGNVHKVRFAEIDAPEKDQPWGQVSKKFVEFKYLNKKVYVDVQSTGFYGREIAFIYFDSININHQIVEMGLAWQYDKYSESKKLRKLENEAKKCKRGLWSDQSPIEPWIWRKNK